MLTGQILLQLLVILLVIQCFGSVCKRLGQQWVIGEILAGLVLGPSLLGLFLPGVKNFLFPVSSLPTLQTLGDIGLILLYVRARCAPGYASDTPAEQGSHFRLTQRYSFPISFRSSTGLLLLWTCRTTRYQAVFRIYGGDSNGHYSFSSPRALS